MFKPATFRAIALLLGATCLLSAGFVGAAPDPSWEAIPGDLPSDLVELWQRVLQSEVVVVKSQQLPGDFECVFCVR